VSLGTMQRHPALHIVYAAVLSPSPESLSLVVEQNTKQTPKRNERAVRHDGWDITIRNDPIGNELAESVAPDVLVDCDADKQAARYWLVRVDGVRAGHTRQGCDLDPRTGEADNNDCLPGPFVLEPNGDTDVAEDHDQDIRNHRR